MAITVPVAGTKLSVANFGKPVADQSNSNTRALFPVAGKVGAAAQTATSGNVWHVIPELTFTYTFKAAWRYRIDAMAGVTVNPGGFFVAGLVDCTGMTFGFVQGSYQAVQANTLTTCFCTGVFAASLGNGIPAGSRTLSLMFGAGATTSLVANPSPYLLLYDLGADV
jgi:hypothetical protein